VLQKLQTELLLIKEERGQTVLDEIEILGGGTRIPAVRQIISKCFGMTRSTLNTESLSYGCTLAASRHHNNSDAMKPLSKYDFSVINCTVHA